MGTPRCQPLGTPMAMATISTIPPSQSGSGQGCGWVNSPPPPDFSITTSSQLPRWLQPDNDLDTPFDPKFVGLYKFFSNMLEEHWEIAFDFWVGVTKLEQWCTQPPRWVGMTYVIAYNSYRARTCPSHLTHFLRLGHLRWREVTAVTFILA